MFEFNLPALPISPAYREFLPMPAAPAIDELLHEYADGVARMRELHAHLFASQTWPVLQLFSDGLEAYRGMQLSNGRMFEVNLANMFDLQLAINARTEKFWFKLFELCGLDGMLPSGMWSEWRSRFTAWREKSLETGIPPFDHDTVRRCLLAIEANRASFFSMRVEAVWKALSTTHVTNAGHQFHERFILNYMFTDSGTTTDKDRAFCDLVNVCSQVLDGTTDPFFNSWGTLRDARVNHCGEWVELMDGALRIRGFKVGTLHVDLHPEIANRLNIALAHLYPNAISSGADTKRGLNRKGGFGSQSLIHKPVPLVVRNYLRNCRIAHRDDGLYEVSSGSHSRISRSLLSLVDEVIEQIGGERSGSIHRFDYHPGSVIDEVIAKGEYPEKVSHQLFATPTDLAAEFVQWVSPEENATCYEPSAGTGRIARLMPLNTYCIEINSLRCMALEKQGFEVKRGDFLKLTPDDCYGLADYVLMNPPYAGDAPQLWAAHFEHAQKFVRPGGVVAAILPEGAVRKLKQLGGVQIEYSAPMSGRFPDTSIRVVFARYRRRAYAGHEQHDLFAA